MNTNHKLGSVRELALFGRLLRGSLIATAVFALAFVVAPYIMSEVNAANNVSSVITWSAIDLTLDPDVVATSGAADPAAEQALSTHGDVEFGGIVPTAKNTTAGDYGTLKVERKTIGVTTRGKYYTVFLSMEGSNQNLNLTYNNATDTNVKIEKTSGTWASPKTLAQNGTSGWGYMVPGATTKDSSGNASPFASLTRSGVSSTFNGKLDTALYRADGVAYTSSIWAAVPVSTSAQQIWKNTTDAGAGFSAQDTFDVYYAVNVDTDVLSGTYQNNVVYTALASAASLDNYSTNLVRTLKFGASGNRETLYFDLAQIGTPVTADKIEVKMVPHNEMTASGVDFDPSKLSSAVLSAALECDVDESSFETVTATQDGRSGSTSKIECELPTGTVADALASTKGDGAYDFILTIDGLNYTYVSKINDGAEPGFVYAGLQSADDTANASKYVKNMQEMTVGVCENTNRWDNGLGSDAKLYTPTASSGPADGGTQITSGVTIGTTADGVGSFALKDTRDGKRYVVRRLADGNCWMAQNLNLDLYTGMTLTSEDTNLTSRDNWVLTDSASSNNETAISADTNAAWVADAGSISRAWQSSHGVGTVTLKRYTYNDVSGEWESSIIAQCTGGTQQAPCYAYTTGNTYYKDVAGVETAVTTEIAKTDGYTNTGSGNPGSPVRGFNAGAYYGKVTYQVRKVTNALGSAWTYSNIGYSTIDSNVVDNSATCTFGFYGDHLQGNTACVLETSGDTMLTQFDNIGMNGYGMGVTKITKAADNATAIDFMNNTGNLTANQMEQNGNDTVVWPYATNAGDYRWHRQGRDGVHVHDWGPTYYNYTQTSPTTAPSYTGTNQACANIGTTQGTLKLSDTTLSFTSCMDGSGANAEALADTRVDGNWYNWYAAVAGSSISDFNNENAADSICPKGWELPKDLPDGNASTANTFNHGDVIFPSFYTLLTKKTSKLATALNISETDAAKRTYYLPNNSDSDLDATRTDYPLHAFPLSYVRSGVYYWNSGGLYYRGGRGRYWSAATYNANGSRYLNFSASYLSPRNGSSKGDGFAVRCVASSV